MKFIVLSLFLLLSLPSKSTQISDIFGNGAFNAKWGDSLSDIKHIFPDGKVKKYVGIVNYEVKDGRKILGYERDKNSLIRFTFDSEGRLNAIAANFDSNGYSHLLVKLNTLFGRNSPPDPNNNYAFIKWPKDKEIEISLLMIPSGFGIKTSFMIQYFGLDKPKVSKEELGF
ncbi:hypothetical protein [Colwellia sp. PAMC 21821]|uniref:hypothetical protein n=1 Tax=Colwellia sp. PAMC 21821 TaxID=1816219 RepID=UPI0009C0BCC9|nr:hypothetical protein [Colwellia sp. PAMC 21821]ARD45065.1 hypothetical protein A3Q33_12550 [Colwellia sp. PAMC 21821]